MRKVLLSTFFSAFSMAAPVAKNPIKLEFEIDYDGRKSNATIITNDQQQARIESVDKNQAFLIEVTPRLALGSKDAKSVDIEVKASIKTQRNGEEVSKNINSRILTTAGKTAAIAASSEDKKNSFTISVKPTLFAGNSSGFFEGCLYAGTTYPEGESLKQVDSYKKCIRDIDSFRWVNQ